jgi:hypothetical protein
VEKKDKNCYPIFGALTGATSYRRRKARSTQAQKKKDPEDFKLKRSLSLSHFSLRVTSALSLYVFLFFI